MPGRSTYASFHASIARVRRLSPTFVRVTMVGEDLRHFGDTCLDQRIKVVFPLPGPRPPGEPPFANFPDGPNWYLTWRDQPETERHTFRTYTPRYVRTEAGEVDVDVAVHGDAAPGSRWAQSVQPKDPVILVGPDARVPGHDSAGVEWTPGQATRILLAGDETAVPAVLNILRELPASTTGQAFLEVPESGDLVDELVQTSAPEGVEIIWLPRDKGQLPGERLAAELPAQLAIAPRRESDGGQEGTSVEQDGDFAAADDASEDPVAVPWETASSPDPDHAYAWLAAESSAVKSLRRHLVQEAGWEKGQVAFMGYWKAGVSQA